ncbi:MAG: hypothetical protein ACI4XM_03045 [Candidatus Coprovivens sp.]
MGKKRKTNYKNNYKYIDSSVLNNATYLDYLDRFRKICLSMFEWVNLPPSMNQQFLELCLYEDGQACFLNDETMGLINTKCVSSGMLNIYNLPVAFNCYSLNYNTTRKLYTGIINEKDDTCILVQNNYDRIPTMGSMELFAYRLYEAERTCDVNIKSQKFPVMVICDEKQRLFMENLYSQYDGNSPFIFGDNLQLKDGLLRAINTGAPFLADKLQDYKKEIWNEALTFLGINNIMLEKKERLISDEANSNNELINLNLQSFLAPRLEACKQFNDKYNLKGTDKEITVRVRSDLYNIIKKEQSIITDYKKPEEIEIEEGEENV